MRKLFAAFCFCFVSLTAFAQTGLWQDVSEESMAPNAVRQVVPKAGRVLRLNEAILRELLTRAPMEFTPAARAAQVVLTIPMPDGSFHRFRIQESPISLPDPSGKQSEFRSYSGQGLDDPTATLRFDISSAGFHAQVLSSGESVYIDPYTRGDRTNFISYFRRDLQRVGEDGQPTEAARPDCLAPDMLQAAAAQMPAHPGHGGEDPPPVVAKANGEMLRNYRTAIAATGEYTTFHAEGSTGDEAKTKALNAMKVTMNRVNGIWERDAAIRYVLLADAEQFKIIYLDATTDPYTGDNASAQADENQANLDAVITDAAYDIGHVFSTAPGGVGAAGVCVTGGKARGATGSPQPRGDAFDVDYVAHEIIHQWGGNHTFNDNANGQCGGGNRTPAGAYEPGSGSTLASYAGICGPANLQKNSDDYFHSGSIAEIIAFATSTATCAQQVATGNKPPSVTAPAEFTIPRETPFTLTASATDADGDTLTYGWEQFDLGNPSPPEEDDGTRPIFRPYKPTTSPSRTFPSLKYILNNANVPPATNEQGFLTGEVMPKTTRTMKFRVFVRDNRLSGGGTNFANTNVNVRADSGPFAVTEPNTAGTYSGAQTVTWSVNNTNVAPVSAANVKITLSTDGGQSFPIVLAASAPNTGSANVTLPDNIATTTARIKVEAIGNIFFDISDANFTVVASPTCSAVNDISPKAGTNGDTITITGVNFTNGGNVTAVKFSNSASATFTVVNDTTITAIVPAGAVSGPITISKTGCPDAQSPSFTVCPSAPAELKVDDGGVESASGFASGGYFYVNRLTPASYPATLSQVSIFWDPFQNFPPGTPINVVAGANTGGTANIDGTVFQSVAATAGAQPGFTTYTLPQPITISAGDFVVGFSVPTVPAGALAVAIDTNNPQSRSYNSNGGSTFQTIATGNYMIRAAQVYSDCNVAPGPTPTPTATPTATPSATPTPSPSATPTVQFDSTNVSVKEDTGEATLTVTRTGDTSGTTSVNYATADGTAKAGEDYTAESGTVTFAPNETKKEITIPVSNDPSDEPAETFAVNLTEPPSAARGSSRPLAAVAESASANITIVDDDEPTTLGNIATRMRVETGENALIGGIIITGNEPKKIIVRAIGPSLQLDGRLEDPQLQLFDANQNEIAFNNNWKEAPNRQEIIDSTVAPNNDLEPAILISLAPGNYTAVVRGVNNTTGIGVAEIYDLDREADSKLANIATRGFVGTEPNVMIGGFIVLGATPQKVILRAIGPSLPLNGKLNDPRLDLVDNNGNVVRSNNNWKQDQQADIEATGIPPQDERESAIVETLAPGPYTAIVRGVGDTTGIAVVEVYALQ